VSGQNVIEQSVSLAASALRGHVAPGDEDTLGWFALAASLFDGDIPVWFAEWTDLSAIRLAHKAMAEVAKTVSPADLTSAVERHLANTDSGGHEGRRRSGAYYTPAPLVELLVERTIGPLAARASTTDELLAIRIFDPAVGCGDFLLAAMNVLTQRAVELTNGELDRTTASQLVVERSLFGADANPLAALVASGVLHRMSGASSVRPNIQWADSIVPSHKEVVTPSGAPAVDLSAWPRADDRFDAVIGNPPWGPVKPAIRHFLSHESPGSLTRQGSDLQDSLRDGASATAVLWDAHASRARAYSKSLRECADFTHQGSGDADLYQYFVERAHSLVRDSGRIGLLVPGGILRAEGAAPLRRLLLDSGTIELAMEFNNNKRLFDIHPMFRFVMLVWQQGRRSGVRRAHFGVQEVEQARSALAGPALGMGSSFLRRIGGARLSIPELRSKAEASLLDRLYAAHPRLDERGTGPWNVSFVRELDMSKDSHRFRSAADRKRSDDLLPLFEGRMVQQFDDRAKRYVSGAGRRAVWKSQGLGQRVIEPHYFVSRAEAMAAGAGSIRPGFCDVTGHANERTMLAALIPAEAVAGNKVPTVRFDRASPELPYLFTGLFNSLVLDWIARRRVSTTLNYFQLFQLPFPRIDPDSLTGKAIADDARELSLAVEEWTPETLKLRAQRRAGIDAAVALAFGVSFEDLVLIFSDFPLLDRYQPELSGERSTVTRDLLLATFAATSRETSVGLSDLGLSADGGPNDLQERLDWAELQGQVAYLPGELAKEILRSRNFLARS
jgi:hypothetical protein